MPGLVPGEGDADPGGRQLVLVPVEEQDLEPGQLGGDAALVTLGRRVVLHELRPADGQQLQHRAGELGAVGQGHDLERLVGGPARSLLGPGHVRNTTLDPFGT